MNSLMESTEILAVDISFTKDDLVVTLSDGRTVSAPLVWFVRLLDATPKQRANWELIGGGIGIHWEDIDEDISVASLLQPNNFMSMPDTRTSPVRKHVRRNNGHRHVHKKPVAV